MNWITRKSEKNKHLNVILLMQKFVLVPALFVMMTVTAHAGAFLYNIDIGEVGSSTDDTISFDSSSSDYDLTTVFNRSQTHTTDIWETWGDGDETDTGVYHGDEYTGFYLGTFQGNVRNKNSILPLINYFLDDYTFTVNDLDWVKFESVSTGVNTKNQDNLVATVNTNTSDRKSGTWSVQKSDQEQAINFYTVKGSNMFALYYIDPNLPTGTGIWTTAHLSAGKGNQPDISNFAAIKVPIMPPDNPGPPVPEPATILLFGVSLIGLTGVVRRKNGKF